MRRMPFFSKRAQCGAAAVEFALVAVVFFMLLLGVVEMGRVLFTWNATVEATRYGARVAVVCPKNDTAILRRMQKILPSLATENVSVIYSPSGCSVANCQQVSVSIQNVQVTTFIPTAVMNLVVPPFTTTLPRESMLNEINNRENPVCS